MFLLLPLIITFDVIVEQRLQEGGSGWESEKGEGEGLGVCEGGVKVRVCEG